MDIKKLTLSLYRKSKDPNIQYDVKEEYKVRGLTLTSMFSTQPQLPRQCGMIKGID